MDRIRKFDEMYGEVDREWVMADTLVNVILLPLMLLGFALPIYEFTGVDQIALIMPIMFFLMIINVKISRYMQVKEKGKATRVYAKFKYIPVEAKDIFKVRAEYLWKYCRKYTLWALIAQMLGCAVCRRFTIWNLIYVIGCGAVAYGVNYVSLYPRRKEQM